jgi:proteic killer suppression protein
VIQSFRCRHTEQLFKEEHSRRFANIQDTALRKLRMLAAATELSALRFPPGNQLEALKHDRQGQHSDRISDKWRLCFVWRDGHAHHVEIVDYR